MKNLLRNWSPVMFYASAIFIFSSFQVHVGPGTDKLLHMAEYALMGFFTARAAMLSWELSRFQAIGVGAAIAACLGLIDEFHQYFVPGRDASGWDALADTAGALLGAALFVALASWLYQQNRLYHRAEDKCC